MKKTSFFFLLILLLVIHVSANEVFLEHDGERKFLSFKSDNPVEISGFNFQVNPVSGTRIDTLKLLPPFEGAVNIQNEKGYAKIAGFTAGSSSSGRLAEISYSGDGKFDIIVIELFDKNLNPVPVTNMRGETTTPAPTPSLQPYNPPPQYQSPGAGSPLNPAPYYPSPSQQNLPVPEFTVPVGRETMNPGVTQSANQQDQTRITNTLSQPTITLPAKTGTVTGEPVGGSQPIPSQPPTSQTWKAPLSFVGAPVALVVLILLARKKTG